jgi:hypothetical protein
VTLHFSCAILARYHSAASTESVTSQCSTGRGKQPLCNTPDCTGWGHLYLYCMHSARGWCSQTDLAIPSPASGKRSAASWQRKSGIHTRLPPPPRSLQTPPLAHTHHQHKPTNCSILPARLACRTQADNQPPPLHTLGAVPHTLPPTHAQQGYVSTPPVQWTATVTAAKACSSSLNASRASKVSNNGPPMHKLPTHLYLLTAVGSSEASGASHVAAQPCLAGLPTPQVLRAATLTATKAHACSSLLWCIAAHLCSRVTHTPRL